MKTYLNTLNGKPVTVGVEPAIPGVEFGYALDISRCVGCRKCVYACVAENNQSRSPQIQYIRVVEVPRGTLDLERGNRLELPWLNGKVVELGRELGVATPAHSMMYAVLAHRRTPIGRLSSRSWCSRNQSG